MTDPSGIRDEDPGAAARDDSPRRWPWTALVVLGVLGVALRLQISLYGYNNDLFAYHIVAGIIEEGGNVYAETHRYNYGPIWFHFLDLFRSIAAFFPSPALVFRTLISLFLSGVDVALFAVLYRRFGLGAATYFLLHPVSIIISGYHRQFEGFALLLGLLAALAFDGAARRGLDRTKGAGLGALTASLATKHLLFAYSFWLAVKERRLRDRLVVLFLPPILFFLSFLPYWSEGKEGIIEHVFLYESFANAPLLQGWFPPLLAALVPAWLPFLAALVLGAWTFRDLDATRSLLFYCALLVVFAPALANQQLVIPVLFVVVYRNPFTILYSGIASLHLLIDSDGLRMFSLTRVVPAWAVGYQMQVGILLLGIVWALFGPGIRRGIRDTTLWIARGATSFFVDRPDGGSDR